jgi:hypothetical protein
MAKVLERSGAMRRLIGIIVATAVLSAAPANAKDVSEAELIAQTTLEPAELSRREAAVAEMSPEQLKAAMVAAVNDRTIIYYQRGHGVFAEYTAPDGKVYMWYPRNKRVVLGAWGLRDFDGPKLCYKYFDAYNGVTGEFESTECIPPEQKLIGAEILDSRPGDPFGLSKGSLPYAKSKLDLPDWPAPSGD